MPFEWDETNAQANLAKHGVAFAATRTVFDDPLAAFDDEWHSIDEKQKINIGDDPNAITPRYRCPRIRDAR
ncbi:BrnT family toxin [Phormidium sp. FACHB-592]|uniref:BrnT family toxin n=1 Tax=Stenomitos frigidus AS-A4 TaxID=2933935 RepID=A0ABV0KCC9_9CYAN|nr:BrnT family toxin [Phormidium sp. FACHB-592]MBD2077494.1 BrnT family toxin [Phormidium sp. FACHB-592]